MDWCQQRIAVSNKSQETLTSHGKSHVSRLRLSLQPVHGHRACVPLPWRKHPSHSLVAATIFIVNFGTSLAMVGQRASASKPLGPRHLEIAIGIVAFPIGIVGFHIMWLFTRG